MSAELRERAAAVAAHMHAYGKELDRARKALEALGCEEAWRDRQRRTRSLQVLQDFSGRGALELGEFLAELERGVREFQDSVRQSFLDQLIASIEKSGLEWRVVGQQPPMLDVGGIQIQLDYDREQAELLYGREPLDKTLLEPTAILDRRNARVGELESVWPGVDVFFDACDAAYRARCGREGVPVGERVHLVDLLPELVVEYELRGLSKKASLGRAELAYGLDRLAREGALERQGRRLELGTATGGSTKDKKRVLFLQAGIGGGQYYLTVRVVLAGGRL